MNEQQPLSQYTPSITVQVCGRAWHLERAADLESLWEAMCEDPNADDERLPYWTELWPSSIALCDWLQQQQETIRQQYCLDLGCGLGLTSLVGQWLGARVLGMDYEAEALHFARINAVRNAIQQPAWLVMDWRRPALQASRMFRVWGGDVMYEKRFVAPVLRFLDHVLAPDGVAWLAEPGRTVYEAFLQALHGGGNGMRWEGKPVFEKTVASLYAQPLPVTVRVWEIRRAQ